MLPLLKIVIAAISWPEILFVFVVWLIGFAGFWFCVNATRVRGYPLWLGIILGFWLGWIGWLIVRFALPRRSPNAIPSRSNTKSDDMYKTEAHSESSQENRLSERYRGHRWD